MVGEQTHNSDALAWAKQELDGTVQTISDRGIIESPILESRLVWNKPFEVVIGQLRDHRNQTEFLWVIGGSMPIDCIHSAVAPSARDAARHFSLKWQLEAAKLEDESERKRLGLNPAIDWRAQAKTLVMKAQYLYSIAEDDRHWS